MTPKRFEAQKRLIDIMTSTVGLAICAFPLAAIALAVKTTTKGPVLHWSRRVGRGNHEFQMPKFRTMYTNTPQVATHLLSNPKAHITPIGKILRKTSLDELPQLFSILKGDMTIVGPRPALFNQTDLVELRTFAGVHELTPGLTGWAQVNGRDELPIPRKVELDAFYLANRTHYLDLKILALTALKVFMAEGVNH